MARETFNEIKLGVFVLAGLGFLILLLYMIGKNRNFFGANFTIKSRFENVQGLKTGNNVRYAGIDIGTVGKIKVLNDTVMEVEMIIEDKMKSIIRKNAIVSIGTDGLVGNKVINIASTKINADYVRENEILNSRRPVDTDDMLRTLSKTNNDIHQISKELKKTVHNINNSTALWKLLNDRTISTKIHTGLNNINFASQQLQTILGNTNSIIENIKSGNGTIGALLYDSALNISLTNTSADLKNITNTVLKITKESHETIENIHHELMHGKGTINKILTDSITAEKFYQSIDNIETGTKSFKLNMEALKHSFLFKGYFKKLEKN